MEKTNIVKALHALYFDSALEMDQAQIERELSSMDKDEPNLTGMSAEQKNKLLARLREVQSTKSLGMLLREKIAESKLGLEQIAQETNLPVQVLSSALDDKIYTNNIPVILLINLLKRLKISFNAAEKSIRRTFEMLHTPLTDNVQRSGFSPAFRRGSAYHNNEVEHGIGSLSSSDGRDLYENEEALNKYITQLDELLNH